MLSVSVFVPIESKRSPLVSSRLHNATALPSTEKSLGVWAGGSVVVVVVVEVVEVDVVVEGDVVDVDVVDVVPGTSVVVEVVEVDEVDEVEVVEVEVVVVVAGTP